MLISLNWLKEYVDIKETPQQVANLLTMHSAEVEEVKLQAELLDNVVVGKIKSIKKHPNADKLSLVETEIDKNQTVQIVCGGTNLKENMYVAVAKIGAKVKWHGEGEPVILKKVKIRGEESNGMICLDSEIGLGENVGTEIMDVASFTSKNIKTGQPLAELLDLNDYIIDIDNKSLTHRSDLFSHIGIAREYAAITNRKLKLPKHIKVKNKKEEYKLNIKIENHEDTPRYMMVVLKNITIKPSPEWIQKRLQAVGIKIINNVVDISNYIMLEYGHPNHTFDYNKIAGGVFHVRRAKKGETMTTLDGVQQNLDDSMLIIEDKKQITDLAGIMGGLSSDIDDNTKIVALEVADFNKTLIRKTATKLNMRTEAVVRFEKGLGLDLTEQVLYRGIELLEKYASAEIASKIYDKKEADLKKKNIDLDLAHLNRVAGINIDKKKVITILKSLELEVQDKKDYLSVVIPLFRTDLNIPEDLIEEITRIYGYDNIPLEPLIDKLEPVEQLPELSWGNSIANNLSNWGFNEVMNYSFYGDKEIQKSLLRAEDHIQIANPLSEDQKYLKTTLLPNLLKNIKLNSDNQFKNIKLFEIGHVYYTNLELKMVAGVLTGKNDDVFYQTKGVVEELLNELNIEYRISDLSQQKEIENYYWQLFEPKADTAIVVNNIIVGTVSIIATKVLQNYNIEKQTVAFFNLNLTEIAGLANNNKKYNAISKYPEVDIDLSIILDEQYNWQDVKDTILQSNEYIKKIEIFDVYQGDRIEAGKKSFAMHIVFEDKSKTLEMKTVEKYREEIMKKLNNKFKAIIRDNK